MLFGSLLVSQSVGLLTRRRRRSGAGIEIGRYTKEKKFISRRLRGNWGKNLSRNFRVSTERRCRFPIFVPMRPLHLGRSQNISSNFHIQKGTHLATVDSSTTKINSTFLNNVTTAPHSATCIRNSNSLRLGF